MSLTEHEIGIHDVAHGLALRIPSLLRRNPGRKPAMWHSGTPLGVLWAYYVDRGLLTALVWNLACEMRPDWRLPDTHLTDQTANQAQQDFERHLLRGRKDYTGEGLSSFWQTYWALGETTFFPGASRFFRCTVHPVKVICPRSPIPPPPVPPLPVPRPAPAPHGQPALANFDPDTIVARFVRRKDDGKIKNAEPGKVGEFLRSFGMTDLLLTTCQKMAKRAPGRALLFWFHHAVVGRQKDMCEAGLARTEPHVAQQLDRGQLQFWEEFEGTLTEREKSETEKSKAIPSGVQVLLKAVRQICKELREEAQNDQ